MERKYSRDWIWQIKSNLQENQSWNQREITEKVRNVKDSYKKDKENNRKSGSTPEFPPFFFNLDEVLSDRAVVKLPEVKQIGCKRTSSTCEKSRKSEKSFKLSFSLPTRNYFTGEWNEITNDLCFSWVQHYLKCFHQQSDFFFFISLVGSLQ